MDSSATAWQEKKIVPRSASRPFIARKSINVYARFHRPKPKGEQSTNRDLAGRKLRTRNYETPKAGVAIAPARPPKFRPSRRDDKPYKRAFRNLSLQNPDNTESLEGRHCGQKSSRQKLQQQAKGGSGSARFPSQEWKG